MSATLAAPNLVASTTTIDPPTWPITVQVFSRMVAAGIFEPFKKGVYLWEGRLVRRMTSYRPHTISVTKTYNVLYDLRLVGYSPEQEQPMALRLRPSVPLPDVKIIRGRSEDYPKDFVTTSAVPLVIEVADSSLSDDRKLANIYAAEGIPVYWIVNIPDRRIEVFAGPSAEGYATCTIFGPDEEVPVIVDGREVGRVRAGDLLP